MSQEPFTQGVMAATSVLFLIASVLFGLPAWGDDVIASSTVAPSVPVVESASVENRHKVIYDLYSETYSATYFNGLVNQTRFRALQSIFDERLQGYLGLNTSGDYTRDEALRYADSFVSPTAGVQFKPWYFLGFFAEYRYLFRTENNELPRSEPDPRYGVYAYQLWKIPALTSPHLEFYGESVALSRFTSRPVTTAWLKLGQDVPLIESRLTITPYVEGFYRESPDTIIGIDEESVRLGGKLKLQVHQMSLQFLYYRRVHSSSVPLGWEGLLVLSADGGLFSW